MDKIQPYLNKLDAELAKCSSLVKLEEQYKVPKTHLTIALWAIYVTSVVSGYGASLSTAILGLVYPGYKVLANWKSLQGRRD
jgi:hypothetical protein